MTEIRFTRDYRGKLTQELFYEAGTVVSLDHGAASQIVAEDAAEIVEKPEPKAKATETKPDNSKSKPASKTTSKKS